MTEAELREALRRRWGEQRAAEILPLQANLLLGLESVERADLTLEDEPDFVRAEKLTE